MKTGMIMDCPNCGPNARVESIPIGRDGEKTVNQLRCEQCKQIMDMGEIAKKKLADKPDHHAETTKVHHGKSHPAHAKKDGDK